MFKFQKLFSNRFDIFDTIKNINTIGSRFINIVSNVPIARLC